MRDLLARYEAGDHEGVWSDLRLLSQLYRAGDPTLYPGQPTVDEVEAILRLTFERVARNVDRLIERLAATGYRFECRAGRHGPAVEPRRSATAEVARIASALDERFGDLRAFAPQHDQPAPETGPEWTPVPVGPSPRALAAFGALVGSVDLRQRYPRSQWDPVIADRQAAPGSDGPDVPGASSGSTGAVHDVLRTLLDVTEAFRDPVADRRRAEAEAEDARPHPHADDPVLSRLGDWDPLVVDLSDVALQVTPEDEADLWPMPDGGLALAAEFAPSFEHKADVSGGSGPSFRLPFHGIDPIVHAEGTALPFTTYLRRCFARGGFFGVPRPVRVGSEDLKLREVEPGFVLPDHPIFATLAEGLEPF